MLNVTILPFQSVTQSRHPPPVYSYSIILFLFLCFLIGIPLNSVVLYRIRSNSKPEIDRIGLLKLHLNISDILVLVFYGLVRGLYEAFR